MLMYKAFLVVDGNLLSVNKVITPRNKIIKNVGGNLKTWIKDQFTSYSTPSAALNELIHIINTDKDVKFIVSKVLLSGNITKENNYGCRKSSKLEVLDDVNISECITDNLFLEIKKSIAHQHNEFREVLKESLTRSDWMGWCKEFPEDKEYFFNKFDFNNQNTLYHIIYWFRTFPEYEDRIKENLKKANNFFINGNEK